MKNILTIVFFVFTYIYGIAQSSKLVILHTNDLHSAIDYTIINGEKTGGFAKIATIIKTEKENHPNNLIVTSGGDMFMGTLFQSLEFETNFQLKLMKEIGFDALVLGNHDLDYYNLLPNIITDENNPTLILSNFKSLNPVFQQFIKPYTIIERDNLKIGMFGIIGENAILDTKHNDSLFFDNQIKSAKKIVKILKKQEKVDFIICLSHAGVWHNKRGKKDKWYGDDINLAKKVNGIDLILGGHSHTKLFKPIIINQIPIIQTGCDAKYIGKLELDINKSKIVSYKYQLIELDDKIPNDSLTDKKIKNQVEKINEQVLKDFNLTLYQPLAYTDFDLTSERNNLNNSNLAILIADAMLYYVNNFSDAKADISVIAKGCIRNNLYKGKITINDIFNSTSLGYGDDNIPGYPLSKIYISAKELKLLLELLLIVQKEHSGAQCFFANLDYSYNDKKRNFHKITTIMIDNKLVDFSKNNKKLYSIVADAIMIDFFYKIEKTTYGLIKVTPKDINGNKIKNFHETFIDFDKDKEGVQEGKCWLALYYYLKNFKKDEDNLYVILDKYKPIESTEITKKLYVKQKRKKKQRSI